MARTEYFGDPDAPRANRIVVATVAFVQDSENRVLLVRRSDNGLWALDPGKAPRLVLTALANPQGLTLDRCGDPIVVEQNAGRIVRLLLRAHSSTCPL